MDKEIVIYIKAYCPYCIKLKSFLNGKKIPFTEVEVSINKEIHEKVIEITGHKTVPAVFVGEEFIGGSEDFYEWHSKNF